MNSVERGNADIELDSRAESQLESQPGKVASDAENIDISEDAPAPAPAENSISAAFVILALLCLASGVSSTFQSGINARLGTTLESGYYSLILAFLLGTAVVMAARLVEVFLTKDVMLGRRPVGLIEPLKCYFYLKPTTRAVHFIWALFPAAIGICFVLVGILITPELGFGLVFVLQIIGGMICSSLIDHFALLGITRSRLTIIAILGVTLACVGAALTVVAQINDNPPEASTGVVIILSILTFLSGVAFSFQGVINNKLTNEVLPSPMVASLMTYVIGSVYALIIAIIASFIDPSKYHVIPENVANMEVWMWFTGFTGLGVIGIAVYAIPVVGAGLWYALMLTGQLTSATIVDHYNTFSLGQYEASTLRIIGVIIAVLAVFLFKMAHLMTSKIFNGIDPLTGDIHFEPNDHKKVDTNNVEEQEQEQEQKQEQEQGQEQEPEDEQDDYPKKSSGDSNSNQNSKIDGNIIEMV